MAKKRGIRTQATIALDQLGISYSEHTYHHDPAVTDYGREAATAIGAPTTQVFKTLITSVDEQLIVAVIPVSTTLNLRALAQFLEAKRAQLAEPATAERKTGYVVGGISPVGQKTPLGTVIDTSAQGFETIFVSGGRRGLDLEISPADLATATNGQWAPIAKHPT